MCFFNGHHSKGHLWAAICLLLGSPSPCVSPDPVIVCLMALPMRCYFLRLALSTRTSADFPLPLPLVCLFHHPISPYPSSQHRAWAKHKQDVTSCNIDINCHHQYTRPRLINNICAHTQFSHSRTCICLHYLLSFSLAKC